MNEIFLKSNEAKVNKIIICILWLVFLGATGFILNKQVLFEAYGSLFLELAVSSIFIWRKKFTRITTAVLLMAILTCTIPYIGTTHTGMIIMVVLCIISLYLNKAMLYSFGFLYNVSYFIIYYSHNHVFDLPFFTNLGFIALTIPILYFVVKRSFDLILLSMKNEEEARNLLSSLNHMVSVIRESTSSLGIDITNCNNDIGILTDVSNNMAATVQEVTDGVVGQTESITHISNMMNQADERMSEINHLTKTLADTSESSGKVVDQGSDNINQMWNQMHIINLAVTESKTTVDELNQSMEEINSFLSAINQISNQTNLLAFNASIEAARAGEAGAGFTVLAIEIKKLADQCIDTVKQIDMVVNNIQAKTQLVADKANNGSIAAKEGEAISKQVLESFNNIKNTFKGIDACIAEELIKTDSISNIFSQIRIQTENISQISHMNASSTEEMLATMQEQNASIETIDEAINNINNSSLKLIELTEK